MTKLRARQIIRQMLYGIEIAGGPPATPIDQAEALTVAEIALAPANPLLDSLRGLLPPGHPLKGDS